MVSSVVLKVLRSRLLMPISSVLSRSARFFLVAGLFYFFGPTINQFISRYFNLLSILFVVLLLLGFWFLKASSKRAMRNP